MDKLLQEFQDGHKLFKDRWQWIVQHPMSCKNVKRDSNYNPGSFKYHQKETYFTSDSGRDKELRDCGVTAR